MLFVVVCFAILGTFLGIYILNWDFYIECKASISEIIFRIFLLMLRSVLFLDLALTALVVLISIYAVYTSLNFWIYGVW